ncbi:Phosphoribosylglycinamide formyltransferase [Aquicella siphonis]|uniref:Phosphoribosylglycinamide formyltransferase n=1 Tax=Aquicella siphonis TaxID=254247 RepID=A0A5E4PJF7_9COXI|nr:phosphoribosylglycinamide formyltransferase [Aquicella siphonis]VVC76553.1 Phosphoribosylglycinamide formyltransferase [Aquicella siphonis]
MIRLGILASTRGTNLDAVVAAIRARRLSASIEIVISNKADAPVLERAAAFGLKTEYIDPAGLTREAFDRKTSEILSHYAVDLVVLIGYMRILSAGFIAAWKNRVINVHPSLLPAHAGLMDMDVHRAVLASGEKVTGCTVHHVTEQVDGGPVILQKTCLVNAHDTPEILKNRVQQLEGEALVAAIQDLSALMSH